jgi:hypothetical protein
MLKWCNCFDKEKETKTTEQLINIYDDIHTNDKKQDEKKDFNEMEYRKTVSIVQKLKKKLQRRNTS